MDMDYWLGCVDPTYVWPQYGQYPPNLPGAQMANVTDTIQHLNINPSQASASEETSDRKVAKVLIITDETQGTWVLLASML